MCLNRKRLYSPLYLLSSTCTHLYFVVHELGEIQQRLEDVRRHILVSHHLLQRAHQVRLGRKNAKKRKEKIVSGLVGANIYLSLIHI